MEKIGFVGAFDKSNLIIYIAKILELMGKKVLVVDSTSMQKIKYIVPSINPTKSYITSFEDIDFAVGFDSWEHIEQYLGISFDTNEEDTEDETYEKKDMYDYVLIDVDSSEKVISFDIEEIEKKYFVTSFDLYSLRKGLSCFDNLEKNLNLTKILFSYEQSKDNEEYLDFISLKYKVNWNDYTLYFQIFGDDNKVFEDNQRTQKISYKRLGLNYKESLSYVIQDITRTNNISQIKKLMKE